MTDMPTVAGQNSLARALDGLLATQLDTGSPLEIVCEWHSVAALQERSRRGTDPWLLIERVDNGGTAVGPVFRPGAPCFDCFLERRRANGGRMCQPVGFALGDCCRAILALAREREWIPLPASWQVELVSGERHRLLPTPKCRGCSSLESVSNAGSMLHAVSPRLGLIHRVMDLPCENRSLVARRAIGAHTDRLAGVRAANHGMAVDEDADRAMARAVGEALERYCSSFAAGHLPRRRPDELAGECVVPDSLIPGTRADRTSTACAWIEGMRVSDGCGVWLPAALVHFPYIDDGEEPIPQIQSSTGLACGQDFNEAIEHAFGEVIERDAFMRAWRGRLPVTRIPPAPGTFEGLHLIRLPGSHGFEVVTALLESEERPFTAVGIAGRRTMGDAVRSATSEALAVREWLREWLDTNPEAPSFPRVGLRITPASMPSRRSLERPAGAGCLLRSRKWTWIGSMNRKQCSNQRSQST